MRYYVGNTNDIPLAYAGDINMYNDIKRSEQQWMFKYYLPNQVFATEEGTDIQTRVENQGYLTAYDDIWLKEGYIVVNFQIDSIKDNNYTIPRLSYGTVATGYNNEWNTEGYLNTKLNYNTLTGTYDTLNFQNGDVALFYTDQKASDDVGTYGTH